MESIMIEVYWWMVIVFVLSGGVIGAGIIGLFWWQDIYGSIKKGNK